MNPNMNVNPGPNATRWQVMDDASLSGMTPLQLAAKLGDHRMCKHILCARLVLLWRWGPLTLYKMALGEIDSSGEMVTDEGRTAPPLVPPLPCAHHPWSPINSGRATT
jgi:hypothetical protein